MYNKLNPQPISSLLSKEFLDQGYYIDKLLPKGSVGIIAAQSGTGKTWFTLEMLKCLSEGTEFLEEFECEQCRVLYLDGEMGGQGVQGYANKLGVSDTSGNFFYQTLFGHSLNDPKCVSELIEYIVGQEIKVVVLDTMRPFMSGIDENGSQYIRPFISRFYELKEHGVSVLFIDHTRKLGTGDSKKPGKDKLIGSQDKLAAVDHCLMLAKNDDIIEVHQLKNRSGKEILPFGYELVDTGEEKVCLEPAFIKEQKPVMKKKDQAKPPIIDLLGTYKGSAVYTASIVKHLKDNHDIGENAARKALGSLVEMKAIERIDDEKEAKYVLINNPFA